VPFNAGNIERMRKKVPEPPVIFLVSLVLTAGLHFVVPIAKVIHSPIRYAGVILIAVGIWLNLWTDRLFKKRTTTVKPFEEPASLIHDGPFRFSRNPMYLGMVTILVGIAIVLGSVGAFIVPIVFFVTMHFVFITHEEKAMQATFGADFAAYKQRVRRWL
jgi:protein-S-isoprenylcysteine O-methyltransferase Ste14